MANPALARDEAAQRAALLAVESYDITLDLTTSDTTFLSTTTIVASCTEPGAGTWIDLVAARVLSATLNDAPVDVQAYDGQRLPLPELAADNRIQVVAEFAYSRTGEGLHRLVDPVDDEVYVYTQFETADAQRVYACFDQPDLKSVYTWHITAPDHWEVVSNSPTPVPTPVEAGIARWDFDTSPRMSTYITALVGGPFHVVRDEYAGPHGSYPLGVFARASMAQYLDAGPILEVTKAGFAFFETAFGHRFPFAKYDQVFVPEFNAGAMENAGCVTITEDYIFRSRVTHVAHETRANTILHELAHMWFGNLVTMRWWDDLWLNESFAEWASHHASVHATEYTDAWTTFANLRKTWAYREDQLPSTHPIATDMLDLEAVKLNFDGITYAKGASALRQLVAWVGEAQFMAGLRSYFAKHKWGNTELRDLLDELEQTSGRDLGRWTEQWLRTPGVNLLRPVAELTDAGTYQSLAIVQEPPSAPAGLPPVLRSHRMRLGCYRLRDGTLTRGEQIELDVVGERTEVAQLAGQPAADVLLLNDDDLTFARIRLGEHSMATAMEHLHDLADPLARTLIWASLWDMTRDAELSTGQFLQLALAGLRAEQDAGVAAKVLLQLRAAVGRYACPSSRARYGTELETAVRSLLIDAAAGGDHQLTFARNLSALATSDESLDLLADLLAGSGQLPGLVIDADLRWALLTRLVATGRAAGEQIDAELARDDTATGRRLAAAARAAIPTAQAKRELWDAVLYDESLPNAMLEATLSGLHIADQRELYRPFREPYFEVVQRIWEHRSTEMGSLLATDLYPGLLVEPETVSLTEKFLSREDLAPGLRRVVSEELEAVERALRCQRRDCA